MISLAIKGNCNKLEEINAPQLYKTSDFLGLQQMINNSFGKKGLYDSYKGMATFNYKKFILQGRNTVKKYLYVFRALMAGSYVLENGQIQPNMEKLVTHYRTSEVKELLRIKQSGLENEPLEDIDNGTLDTLIKEWFEHIDKAYSKSKIPDYPDQKDVKKVERFLIDLRLRGN
jgi:predicted nucleotidyltransferase